MRATPAHVAGVMRKNYSNEYQAVFGRSSASDEEILVDVGKALAAFQETLVTGRTPFDDFRDALERGDDAAAAGYPLAAQRGLRTLSARATAACAMPVRSSPTAGSPTPARPFSSASRGCATWRTAPYMHNGSLAPLRDVL